MEYKYYKVTEGKFVDRVMGIKAERDRIIPEIKKLTGCKDIVWYNTSGVAGYNFEDGVTPCMKTFKDAKLGWQYNAYLPRRSHKLGKALSKEISELGSLESAQNAIDVYKLPKMVLGEATNRGVKMHSSSFCGDYESATFFIVVPQGDKKPYKPECEHMIEVKEWEMLKFMDEVNGK